MTGLFWASKEDRARKWKLANEYLITSNGSLKPEGSKLSRKRKDLSSPLTHSFMVMDNQIIALSEQGVYLGSGIYSSAKLAETEDGQLIALKITKSPEHEAVSKNEALIAQDLGIAGKLTYSTNPNYPHKHYLAYKFLGTKLLDYLKNRALSLDECYELSIKIALKLYELHTGAQSKTNTPQAAPHPPFRHLLPMSGEKGKRKWFIGRKYLVQVIKRVCF